MRGLEPAQLGFKAKPATPEADRLTEDESHDAVLISERTRLRQTGRCPLRSICLTPDKLQAIWRETAESGVDVGLCPLLH